MLHFPSLQKFYKHGKLELRAAIKMLNPTGEKGYPDIKSNEVGLPREPSNMHRSLNS